MIEPDGGQVIDRDAEAELFRELLQLKDKRRLFLISDGEQRGKTTLLRKLKYQCDWDTPRIPCALVKLDELPDNHHYALIEAIYDELETAGVEFPQFQLNRDAIRLRNPEPFAARGSADFSRATISGGQAAGVINNLQLAPGTESVVVNMGSLAWDASLESYAREQAIRCFFDDLRTVCAEQKVVCLIDTVDERANGKLLSWVLEKFVRAQVLDAPDAPDAFILALAGRSAKSPFAPFRLKYAGRVQSVEGLGAWSNEHVRQFLELNRPAGSNWRLDDNVIDFLRTQINAGVTLEAALIIMTAVQSRAG